VLLLVLLLVLTLLVLHRSAENILPVLKEMQQGKLTSVSGSPLQGGSDYQVKGTGYGPQNGRTNR